MIRSTKELRDYYENNKDRYYLERIDNPASDQTVGFLDACDKYDDEFFLEKALVFAILEEGSGSIRHKIYNIEKNTETTQLTIGIVPLIPWGDLTDDMAEWHIIIELKRDLLPKSDDLVAVTEAYDYDRPNGTEEAKATVFATDGRIGEVKPADKCEELISILASLNYDPHLICDCIAEYKVEVGMGKIYEVNLSEKYARDGFGQAMLSDSEYDAIYKMITEAMSGAR